MKKKTVLNFLFLIIIQSTYCQDTKLIGRIIDSDTKKGIKNAQVQINNSNIKTSSNFLGYFELFGDSLEVMISHINYNTVELEMSSIQPNILLEISSVAYTLQSLELVDSVTLDQFFTYKNEIFEESVLNNPQGVDKYQVAQFPGGLEEFHTYIIDRLFITYKSLFAEPFNSELEFYITEEGNIEVATISNPPLNLQLLTEILEKCPKWIPAYQQNTAVKTRYKQRINYDPKVIIYAPIDKYPEYIGGYSAFYKVVSKNMKYPLLARKNDVEGRVFVSFVVNTTGELEEIKTSEGIGFGCDEEAKRLVQLTSGNWKSGSQRDKPIKVKMILPIRFDK